MNINYLKETKLNVTLKDGVLYESITNEKLTIEPVLASFLNETILSLNLKSLVPGTSTSMVKKNIYEKVSRDDANFENILKHFKIDEAVEYLNSIGISSKAIQFDTYNIDEECYDSEDIILIESILSGEKICMLCLRKIRGKARLFIAEMRAKKLLLSYYI